MEINTVAQLSALAHPKRLDLFRLLMRRYPDAVPAGEIARSLDLKANTASTYLSALRQVGLIRQNRVGVGLFYQAEIAAMRGLVAILLNECCQNRPDVCMTNHNHAAQSSMMRPPYNVLFICSANSARSIVAEAILNKIGEGQFIAYSAGMTPAEGPHTGIVKILSEHGYNTSELTSKNIDTFRHKTAPKMDFVITVCDRAANDECPIWSEKPMLAHWGLPDPIGSDTLGANTTQAFQKCYDALLKKLNAFVALPVGTLDRIPLQHALDDIARDIAT